MRTRERLIEVLSSVGLAVGSHAQETLRRARAILERKDTKREEALR